ncbi:hypothetical protein [Streptomyces lavendulae]|uniref:hypothetical protein n=1 Tax=Streptomyces lavendulae TaxID=1914 RepID=UPI0024A09DD8|nr:hypothetical protein [Streptomyces lavendulae]GLW00909.1 hypothetical protein Slala05_45400 [Streptomyces lavendulae subsp. lavendulae]
MSLHTLADGTTIPLPPMPKPTPPSDVMGATETGYDVRAVVVVQVALTRDMLAVALEDGCSGVEEHPDTWLVEFIRESVELYLGQAGYMRLLEGENLLVDFLWSEPAGPCRDRVQAVYRAIDRAYPNGR